MCNFRTITLLFISQLFIACSSHETLLLGTQTKGNSEGIYALDFNPKNGKLSHLRLLAKTDNPTFLCQNIKGNQIYSVSEGHKPSINAWLLSAECDSLLFIKSISSIGAGPCHISIDRNGKHIAVANYGGGSVLCTDKKLSYTSVKQHKGGYPDTKRQRSPHAHCAIFSPDNKYLFVVDLGLDAIIAYQLIDSKLGKSHIALQLEKGNGSRHLCFNQKGDKAYLAAELSSKIFALNYNATNATFSIENSLSTLPSDYKYFNTVAEVKLSQKEDFVYVSNRGHNSIACFKIQKDDQLTFSSITKVQGDFPRNFTFSPNGNFLLISNQKSHNISVFKVNKKTGELIFQHSISTPEHPMCLIFSKKY